MPAAIRFSVYDWVGGTLVALAARRFLLQHRMAKKRKLRRKKTTRSSYDTFSDIDDNVYPSGGTSFGVGVEQSEACSVNAAIKSYMWKVCNRRMSNQEIVDSAHRKWISNIRTVCACMRRSYYISASEARSRIENASRMERGYKAANGERFANRRFYCERLSCIPRDKYYIVVQETTTGNRDLRALRFPCSTASVYRQARRVICPRSSDSLRMWHMEDQQEMVLIARSECAFISTLLERTFWFSIIRDGAVTQLLCARSATADGAGALELRATAS